MTDRQTFSIFLYELEILKCKSKAEETWIICLQGNAYGLGARIVTQSFKCLQKQTKLRVPLWKLSKMCSFKIMFEKKWMIGFVFDYNDFELITCSLIKQTTLTKICRVFLNNSNHKTVNQSIERFHGGTQWRSPDTNSLLQSWTETSKPVAHLICIGITALP